LKYCVSDDKYILELTENYNTDSICKRNMMATGEILPWAVKFRGNEIAVIFTLVIKVLSNEESNCWPLALSMVS